MHKRGEGCDQHEKCFACARPFRAGAKLPTLVDTRDGQTVLVGPECAKKIEAAGEAGYQPSMGGPRLYPLKKGNTMPDTFYRVTLKDNTTRDLSIQDFRERFPKTDATFRGRLEQFRTIFPTAKDWEMVDTD